MEEEDGTTVYTAEDAAALLEKKASRSAGNFFWMRVASDEKALIERRRQKLLVSSSTVADTDFDADFDADISGQVQVEHGCDTGAAVDDIPVAQQSSLFLDEEQVTEKLQELEAVRAENTRLEAEVRSHEGILIDVENELKALNAIVTFHKSREVELEGAMQQMQAAKVELEAALCDSRAQGEAQRRAADETFRTAQKEWQSTAASAASATQEAALNQHAQELDEALQRESVLRALVIDLEAQLRDAMEWQGAAKRREEGLRQQLRAASTVASAQAAVLPLQRKLRQSNTVLLDVVFPDQQALGLVIVPHELQCSRVTSADSGGPVTPTKTLSALRPLGEDPIIDCCMVTSSSVAACLQHGDVLLAINGLPLVSQRIDELHGEERGVEHFNAVMDAVAHASRPRRLRFLRLARDMDVAVAALPAKDAYGSGSSSRTVSEKESLLLFDGDQAAMHHVEHYEYTISNAQAVSSLSRSSSFPHLDSISTLAPPQL